MVIIHTAKRLNKPLYTYKKDTELKRLAWRLFDKASKTLLARYLRGQGLDSELSSVYLVAS
jgi:ribosomal protein S15P/S13E